MPQPPPVAYIEAGKLHKNEGNRPHGSGKADLSGLALTITHLGIMSPLLVRPHPRREGHFVIIAGHRRYEAGLMAGLGEFPCTMRRVSAAERNFGPVLTEVVEQTQRVPWGPVEFALKLGQLRDGGMSQADIARYTGLTPSTISHHLELLDLDRETLQKVRTGEISVGAAHEAVKAFRADPPPPRPGGSEVRPRRRTQAAGQRRKPRPYFNATHPLAAAAQQRCSERQHPVWERIHKTACEPCWESVIVRHALSQQRPAEPEEAAPAPAVAPLRVLDPVAS